jgi:hypothetical protein
MKQSQDGRPQCRSYDRDALVGLPQQLGQLLTRVLMRSGIALDPLVGSGCGQDVRGEAVPAILARPDAPSLLVGFKAKLDRLVDRAKVT